MVKIKIFAACIAIILIWSCGNKQSSAPGASGDAPAAVPLRKQPIQIMTLKEEKENLMKAT
jgi:hypothetical protein